MAQQVASNLSQQSKSSNQGKTGRITPKTNLAVLDTLEEQSESDMSEVCDQEPCRRMPKERGKYSEKQITQPQAKTAESESTAREAVTEQSEDLAVEEPQEFENFGRGIQNRSSGIEADPQRRSLTEADDNKEEYLETYDSEPGSRKWERAKRSAVSDATTAADSDSVKTQHPTRHTDRPSERPPSPPKLQRPEIQELEIESYEDEPGARRRRPPRAADAETRSVHQDQQLATSTQEVVTSDNQIQHGDVYIEENKEGVSSSEDDEVAQISAAADERRKARQARKQAALMAQKEKEQPEANAMAARRLAEEGEANAIAARRLAEEGEERARQAAIHQEMLERERLAQVAQEEAMLQMQQYVDEQRAAGEQVPPAGQERIKGRRQMGGPQGRSHATQQQQYYQDQQGYPNSNQQYPPGYDSQVDPSRYEQGQYGESACGSNSTENSQPSLS